MRYLGVQEVEDVAIGSAVLGTGGGGDPYLGKLAAIQEIKRKGPLELVTIDELPDDTMVVFPFAIGSPVPYLERITMVDELIHSYHAMSRYFGKKIGAMMSSEIGGANSVIPFAVASRLGLPLIDGDTMGRAYPELELTTLTLYGIGATPIAVSDEHGNSVILDTVSNRWAERLARPAAVEMGAIAGGVGFPATVAQLKEAAVLGSVSYAESVGRAIRTARAEHKDAVNAVLEVTNGFRLFDGRIVDVSRRIERGWALGETTIMGTDEFAGQTMTVQFQNEHLVAILNSEIIASVPDLIAILDGERGEPITTENLRYGFRVSVIAMPCDPKWRTPAGVALGGPRHFRYDIDFVPVEERFAKKV